ncbi:Taurine catabolism dioxygenase TauD, TfdA family [Mesorhizobium sp. YR577]|nr:Taurine catabolism dioxygenase TauD, TfdA family [Mesorhizobium sp. YR577]
MRPNRLSPELSRQLQHGGYAFIPQWQRSQATREVASLVGTVLDLDAFLPGSGIPTVQTLKPKKECEAPKSQYSGMFGLEEFPLHTDLAHWAKPPRYLMLRCVLGTPHVGTRLLPASAIVNAVGLQVLQRALVKPRRSSRYGKAGLLTLAFSSGSTLGLRWDSLFLTPMNAAARAVTDFMTGGDMKWGDGKEIFLLQPGDTLIIDNWLMLHGRSRALAGRERIIERIYLSEAAL